MTKSSKSKGDSGKGSKKEVKSNDSSSTKKRKKSASESPTIKEQSTSKSDKASKVNDSVIMKPESPTSSVREVTVVLNKSDKKSEKSELQKRSQSDKETPVEVKLSPSAIK